MPVASGGLQWEADNRSLMFQVTTRTPNGWPAQLYLLDTAAPGGSLLASSARIPLPGTYLGLQHNRKQYIVGMPLITGDGRKLVAPFYHHKAPPKGLVSRSPSSRCAPESSYGSCTRGGPAPRQP